MNAHASSANHIQIIVQQDRKLAVAAKLADALRWCAADMFAHELGNSDADAAANMGGGPTAEVIAAARAALAEWDAQ